MKLPCEEPKLETFSFPALALFVPRVKLLVLRQIISTGFDLPRGLIYNRYISAKLFETDQVKSDLL